MKKARKRNQRKAHNGRFANGGAAGRRTAAAGEGDSSGSQKPNVTSGAESSIADGAIAMRVLRWTVLSGVALFVGIGVLYVTRPYWRHTATSIDSVPPAEVWGELTHSTSDLNGMIVGPPSPVREEIRPLIDEATAVAKRLRDRFPGQVEPLAVTAQLQQQFGNATDALTCWRECIRLNPGFVDAYCGIGSILIERGEYQEAEKTLRRAVAIDLESPQAGVLLATALSNQGKTEETISLLERIIGTGRAAMPHFLLLAQAHLRLQQYEEAKRLFQRTLEMAPDYQNAYYGLATACTRLGQEEEARRYQEKFKELQTKDLQARIDESKSYDDLGSARQTVAGAYVAAGHLYLAHRDDRTAKDHWTRAVELDPTAANYFLLGTACERCGDREAAIGAIGKAVRLEPGNAQYRRIYLSIRETK